MFTKFIKNLFKETTNVATTGSVTLNTSGTYNPKYGKQHIIISGKGGTGSYTAGADYYNYVEGTPKYTFVQGNPNYTGDVAHPAASTYTRGTDTDNTYTYTGNTLSASSTTTVNATDDHPGTAYSSGYKYEYANVVSNTIQQTYAGEASTLNAVINSTPVWYYTVSGNYTVTYASSPGSEYFIASYINVYASSDAYVGSHTYAAVYNVVAAPASYNSNVASIFSFVGEFETAYYALPSPTSPHAGYANPVATNGTVPAYYNTAILPIWTVWQFYYSYYTHYNYAWTERGPADGGTNSYYNYDGKNADQYPYAGTNNPSTNTGESTNVFGVSIPGGYGGAATAILPTIAPYLSVNKLTSVSITVPSGGYVTITYKI